MDETTTFVTSIHVTTTTEEEKEETTSSLAVTTSTIENAGKEVQAVEQAVEDVIAVPEIPKISENPSLPDVQVPEHDNSQKLNKIEYEDQMANQINDKNAHKDQNLIYIFVR